MLWGSAVCLAACSQSAPPHPVLLPPVRLDASTKAIHLVHARLEDEGEIGDVVVHIVATNTSSLRATYFVVRCVERDRTGLIVSAGITNENDLQAGESEELRGLYLDKDPASVGIECNVTDVDLDAAQ
jgi:hypothetical protein